MNVKALFTQHFSADSVMDLDENIKENGELDLSELSEQNIPEVVDLSFLVEKNISQTNLEKAFQWAQNHSTYFVTRLEYKGFLNACHLATGIVLNEQEYLAVKF